MDWLVAAVVALIVLAFAFGCAPPPGIQRGQPSRADCRFLYTDFVTKDGKLYRVPVWDCR